MAGLTFGTLPAFAVVRFAFAFLLASAASALGQAAFHAAHTAPQRALEQILKRADKDEHLLDNLLQGRGTNNFKPTVNYQSLLTLGLIEAIRKHEQALVGKDCKGIYLEGEICGLDYSPITCGQDSGTRYEFRTLQAEPSKAKIDFRWSGGEIAASYRLVKVDERWKIDGISCTGADAFNMQ